MAELDAWCLNVNSGDYKLPEGMARTLVTKLTVGLDHGSLGIMRFKKR